MEDIFSAEPCGCDIGHKPPHICNDHLRQNPSVEYWVNFHLDEYRRLRVLRAMRQPVGSICSLCLPNDDGVSKNPDCVVCGGTGSVLPTRERVFHEISCPKLTGRGECACKPVIVTDKPKIVEAT